MKTALELLGDDGADCNCKRCKLQALELVAQRAREEMREMVVALLERRPMFDPLGDSNLHRAGLAFADDVRLLPVKP